jgi:hypothetical protein
MRKTLGLMAAFALVAVTGCGEVVPVKAEMIPVCADGSKTCSNPQELIPDCGGLEPCDDPIKGPDVYCC